jgi:hypothetical protein
MLAKGLDSGGGFTGEGNFTPTFIINRAGLYKLVQFDIIWGQHELVAKSQPEFQPRQPEFTPTYPAPSQPQPRQPQPRQSESEPTHGASGSETSVGPEVGGFATRHWEDPNIKAGTFKPWSPSPRPYGSPEANQEQQLPAQPPSKGAHPYGHPVQGPDGMWYWREYDPNLDPNAPSTPGHAVQGPDGRWYWQRPNLDPNQPVVPGHPVQGPDGTWYYQEETGPGHAVQGPDGTWYWQRDD